MNVINFIQKNKDLSNLYDQAVEKDSDCLSVLQKIYTDCISNEIEEDLIFSEIYRCLSSTLKNKRIKVVEANPFEPLFSDILIRIFGFIPETLGNLRTTCKFVKNTLDTSSSLTAQRWFEHAKGYCLKHNIGLEKIGIALLEKRKIEETRKWLAQMLMQMNALCDKNTQEELKIAIINLTFELSLRYLDINSDPNLAEKNAQQAYRLRKGALNLDDVCFNHVVFNSAYLKFCVKFNLFAAFQAYLNKLEYKEDIDEALIELIPALVVRWKDQQFHDFKSFVKSLPHFSKLDEDETDFSLFYAKLGASLLENGFEHDALELKNKINEEDRVPFRILDLRNFLFEQKNILEAEGILNSLSDFQLCEAYLVFMEFYASIGKTTRVVSYLSSFKQKIYEIASADLYQSWKFIFRAIKIAYVVDPEISTQTVQNFFDRLNESNLSPDKKMPIVDSVFSSLISNNYPQIIENFSGIFEKHVSISQCWMHLNNKEFEKILPVLKQTSLSFHLVFISRYLEKISNEALFIPLFDEMFDYLSSTATKDFNLFTEIWTEILTFFAREAKNQKPLSEKIAFIRRKTEVIEKFAENSDSNKLKRHLGVLHLFLNNIDKAKTLMESIPVYDRVIALIAE